MSRTCKTSQVMNLINDASCSQSPFFAQTVRENPTKVAHKTRQIITSKNDIKIEKTSFKNPALKLPEEQKPVFNSSIDKMVNVVSIVVNEQLTDAIKRFNVCSCESCCNKIYQNTISRLPPKFIYVSTKADVKIVEEQIVAYRPLVLKELTKILIEAKKRPLHNVNRA